MSEAILDISWKDYFLDEIIEGMPPGFGFSAFRDHSENREAKPYYVTVWKLTWRGKDIGRLIFDDHIRRVTYINGKNACDIFNPDPEAIANFWKKVIKPRPMHICVTESHRDIYGLLRELREIELINLDAHHDYGYQQTKVLDCSNWAYHGVKKKIISKYKLYYPEWRKGHEEEGSKKCEVHYGLPPKSEYDVVFICRSPCWTPPWADDQWLKLVTGLQAIPGTIDRKFGNPRAYKPRNMSLAQAKDFAKQYDEMTKKLLEVSRREESHSPVEQVK